MHLQQEGPAGGHAKAEEANLETLWSFYLQGIRILPSSLLKRAAGSERQQSFSTSKAFDYILTRIGHSFPKYPFLNELAMFIAFVPPSPTSNFWCDFPTVSRERDKSKRLC